jgi:hypothetical protein
MNPGSEYTLRCLSRSELLTRMTEHASRLWVTLYCLSRSEPLTGLGEHESRKWVTLQCLNIFELALLTRMVQNVSFGADQNHWQEWLNTMTYSASEYLLCVCADQDPWVEQLKLFYFVSLIVSVFCSLTFLQAHSLVVFLDPYFKSNNSGQSSIISSITSIFGGQKSSLIFFTGLLPLYLFDFYFILLLCPQRYSSAWRTPFGTSAEMATLWNCLRNLSHHTMLRVVRGRRRRQKLIYYWEIKVDFQRLMNSRQSFVILLLIIVSVSLLFLFTRDTSSYHFLCLNTAHPVDQASELEWKNDNEKSLLGSKTWQWKSLGNNLNTGCDDGPKCCWEMNVQI